MSLLVTSKSQSVIYTPTTGQADPPAIRRCRYTRPVMERASPPAGSSPPRTRRQVPPWFAAGLVLLPFAVGVVRLMVEASPRITLPDDLALIELHTRNALSWAQSLGPFDRNNWNHPGPSLFYLLSIPARLIGSGPRALFVGAATINGAAAACSVWAVRRRAGDGAALWAAGAIGLLAVQISFTGPLDVTYSESRLGALVSPWNPTVIVFPLLLTLVLCAAGPAGSPLSLLGAAVSGTFVVQTDIATAPLVAVCGLAAVVATVARTLMSRRAGGKPALDPPARARRRPKRLGWWAAGGTLVVLAWIPPLVEQITGHPGNLTRIARYFSAARQGQNLAIAFWGTVTAQGVLATGPARVIGSVLWTPPVHPTVKLIATGLCLVAAVVAVVGGILRHRPFAISAGAVGILGTVVSLLSALRIPGLFFGYLIWWSIVCPVVSLIGLGSLGLPRRLPASSRTATRLTVAGLACVIAVAAVVQVARIPPLSAASDPVVGRLAALVVPRLHRGEHVYVEDDGPDLIQLEEFIGFVNQLDSRGIRPSVSREWRVEFGTAYVTNGREHASIFLTPWQRTSASLPGYLGHAGRIAIQLVPRAPGR